MGHVRHSLTYGLSSRQKKADLNQIQIGIKVEAAGAKKIGTSEYGTLYERPRERGSKEFTITFLRVIGPNADAAPAPVPRYSRTIANKPKPTMPAKIQLKI